MSQAAQIPCKNVPQIHAGSQASCSKYAPRYIEQSSGLNEDCKRAATLPYREEGAASLGVGSQKRKVALGRQFQMRNLLLPLLAAVLFSRESFAADWSLMSIGANGQATLVDAASMISNQRSKTIWILTVSTRPWGAIPHDAVRNRVAIDCDSIEFSNLNYIEYLSGQVVQEIKGDNEKRSIVPGTTLGDVFEYVCRDKPILERQKHFTEEEIRRLLGRAN
jgi:hypothetical protein